MTLCGKNPLKKKNYAKSQQNYLSKYASRIQGPLQKLFNTVFNAMVYYASNRMFASNTAHQVFKTLC